MKRFASLDFLRGLAILIMICLHIISHVLDLDLLFADINNQPIINLVLLVVLPFLGGLAGFFLLTSAISNMVSMYKVLEKGSSVKNLVVKQVVGGFLLLIFAMLAEGLIGYLGAFGNLVGDLGGTLNWTGYANTALTRWNHFEAIHTIAWCVIVNGIIQGILSRNDQWKNVPRLIRSYLIIAVIMVVLTVPVWIGMSIVVPGYPWAKSTLSGADIYTPKIGTDPWWYVLISPFLTPLAAPMEPLFPYLAVSCIGSIIGIVMSQPKEKIPPHFTKKVLLAGLMMFIIGAIGVVITIVGVMDQAGFMQAVYIYKDISFHRHWFPDQPKYGPFLNYSSWLWQFLVLNGFGLAFTMLVIYLTEFRGVGGRFANFRTVTIVRRFGFTAFTNYNNQWYYTLVWILVSLAITGERRAHMLWGGVIVVLLFSVLAYHYIMRLWEKVGYVGSIEWMIGSIAAVLIPAKRDPTKKALKWWQRGQLDVKNAFYEAEWLSVITPDAAYHDAKCDSHLVAKLAKIALGSVIFFPFTVFTLLIALDVKKTEGDNPALTRALRVSIIGTIITVIFLIFCFAVTPNLLGFQL